MAKARRVTYSDRLTDGLKSYVEAQEARLVYVYHVLLVV